MFLFFFISYLSVVSLVSVLCWLVFSGKKKKMEHVNFGEIFCTAKSPHPPPSFSLCLSSISLFVDKNVCMLMVRNVGKVVDNNRSVSSLCFKAPPVSLTACHFRQIFQSVTLLQKWNHRTLRIKWFHIIFFIVLFFCIQTVLHGASGLLLPLCKIYIYLNMKAAVEACICGLGKRSLRHNFAVRIIPLHGIRLGSMCKDFGCILHVTVSVSQSCFSSQNDCCAFFFFFTLYFIFFSKGISTSIQ